MVAPDLGAMATSQPDPVADDADEDEDHADDDDEMSRVLAHRKAGDAGFSGVRDEIMLDEIEEESERHHSDSESGESRERRPRGRRMLNRIGQWLTSTNRSKTSMC